MKQVKKFKIKLKNKFYIKNRTFKTFKILNTENNINTLKIK